MSSSYFLLPLHGDVKVQLTQFKSIKDKSFMIMKGGYNLLYLNFASGKSVLNQLVRPRKLSLEE